MSKPRGRKPGIALTKKDDIVPPDRAEYKQDGFVINVSDDVASQQKVNPQTNTPGEVVPKNILIGRRRKRSPVTDHKLLENQCKDDFKAEDYEALSEEELDSEDEGDADYDPDADELEDDDGDEGDEGDDEFEFEESNEEDDGDEQVEIEQDDGEEYEDEGDEIDEEELEG
jgi:hypothetical protein